MQKENLLILSIKDFLTKKMLSFSLLPLVITTVVMYILFFSFADISIDQFSINSSTTTIENGVTHTDSISTFVENSDLFHFLTNNSFTSSIGSFLVYSIGAFLTLYLSIFIAIIVVGFLTPNILKELHTRHYGHLEMTGYSNFVESIFLLFKWSATMMLLFFLLIPLYFIPIINIIALHFPLYYFFHKMLNYDIASTICLREEAKEIRFKYTWDLRLKTLAMYILSLVPFTVFFTAVFYIVYLGNTYFTHLEKIKR